MPLTGRKGCSDTNDHGEETTTKYENPERFVRGFAPGELVAFGDVRWFQIHGRGD